MLDEITVSRAITEVFMKDFMDAMEVDVAIGGAGPAGMTAAYYLAKAGIKTVIFERQLRVGGGSHRELRHSCRRHRDIGLAHLSRVPE